MNKGAGVSGNALMTFISNAGTLPNVKASVSATQGTGARPQKWTASAKIAPLILMMNGGLAAQSNDVAAARLQPDAVLSVDGKQSIARIHQLWRSVMLSQGDSQLAYREPDPLGRVNPLNSETGSITTRQIAMRWRGQLTTSWPEMALQANFSHARGQTDYSGYLQQGSTLTPYDARTGNSFQALRLRVGLPLAALFRQSWAQHISPYVEQGQYQWQRSLTQYSETLRWQITALGVFAIWPLSELGAPQLARLALEADVAVGRTMNANISAPKLDFSTHLAEANSHSAALSLNYAATPTWSLALRYVTQRARIGASASIGGLQFPGANFASHGWLVGIGAQL